MAISIAIASGKGGVGKTTVALNLGVALAQLGKNVTILDANVEVASIGLYLGLNGSKPTLHSVLAGEAQIKDAIHEVSGAKVVTAGIRLESLRKIDLGKFRECANSLLEDTDILLIDAPPGLGSSAITAISAARAVLLVVTPDITSLSGALKAKRIAEHFGARILGAVINRATKDKTELGIEEIEKVLMAEVIAEIPEDPEIRRAAAFGQPAVAMYPNSPASQAFKKLAGDLDGIESIDGVEYALSKPLVIEGAYEEQ
ncbi:MAG: P-loop NTPase [Euryarchaeota archaeon]|nr:P-loop NTPase [Euryarchaeota archaeon]